MRLWFKQRVFSWFDSYDIYDENGQTVYTVEGKLDWGHRLHIHNSAGEHIATVKQRIWSFLPRFDIYIGDEMIGTIQKELTFLRPTFTVTFNGWTVEGNFFQWDYQILNALGNPVAFISKDVCRWTDTYSIDVRSEQDALCALMVVLAIDAEKCSRDD